MSAKKLLFSGGVILLLVLLLPTTTRAQDDVQFWLSDIAWSPDGTRLAVATTEGVIVYDTTGTANSARLWQFETGMDVQTVVFSPDGTRLAAGLGDWPGGDGWLIVWEAQTGAEITALVANNFTVNVVAWSPDGSQIATGGGYSPLRMCGDYKLSVWDTATWELVAKTPLGHGTISAAAYSPDGRYLAYSNTSYTATQIVETATFTPVSMIPHEGARGFQFDADSTRLTVYFPGSVAQWAIRTEPELHLVRVAQWESTCTENDSGYCTLDEVVLGIHPALFATRLDTGMQVRTVDTYKVVFALPAQDGRFTHAAISADGTWLALISDRAGSAWGAHYRADWQITLWDIAAQTPLATLEFE